jgi:chromosome segregation ATPase
MNQREERIKRLERRMGELDTRIHELEADIHKANTKLKEDLAPRLKEIEDKRRQVERLLAELKLKEAEAWDDQNLETGLFAIFDDIGKRIGKLFESLR